MWANVFFYYHESEYQDTNNNKNMKISGFVFCDKLICLK